MKRRINLFSKKKQQQPIPTFAYTIRSYGILVMCICFVLSIVSGIAYYVQYQKLMEMNDVVSGLEQQMAANDQIQGNIVFFINKKEQLKSFLKDDAQFSKYYNLLQDTLKKANTDAVISSVDLSVGKNVAFVIRFTDFENSEKLLNFIETPEFLDNFQSLTLQSFTVTRAAVGTENVFQLQLNGQFKDDESQPTDQGGSQE